MPKYTVLQRTQGITAGRGGTTVCDLFKDGQCIATFHGDYPHNITNAQKVCNLLNETSRSQGKYPQ